VGINAKYKLKGRLMMKHKKNQMNMTIVL